MAGAGADAHGNAAQTCSPLTGQAGRVVELEGQLHGQPWTWSTLSSPPAETLAYTVGFERSMSASTAGRRCQKPSVDGGQ